MKHPFEYRQFLESSQELIKMALDIRFLSNHNVFINFTDEILDIKIINESGLHVYILDVDFYMFIQIRDALDNMLYNIEQPEMAYPNYKDVTRIIVPPKKLKA